METIPRPRQHLIAAAKLYPGAWRAYDQFRASRGRDLPQWPDYVFAPIAAAYAIVSGGGPNRVPLEMIGDVGRLAALAAWRPTQGIYRFDPTLFSALTDTPLSGDLPAEVLHRLPEWAPYIETPGLAWQGSPLQGFFAHVEYDPNNGREELRLLLDSDAELAPIPIHLGPWPLAEAVARALDVSRVHAAALSIPVPGESQRLVVNTVEPLVSLLLYLCAEEADFGAGTARPANPVPTRTKHGLQLFPPDSPRTWDVGVRLGAALRRGFHDAETGQADIDPLTGRTRPRAHIRRAHWHTYLSGTGRSQRRLKWMPPIPVNVENLEAMPATVRPVRASDESSG